jgi:hypothetical protein
VLAVEGRRAAFASGAGQIRQPRSNLTYARLARFTGHDRGLSRRWGGVEGGSLRLSGRMRTELAGPVPVPVGYRAGWRV